MAEEIAKGAFPGCVVAVGRHGKLVLLKAYGHRQLKPTKVPMTTDTLFDLASVTKRRNGRWMQGEVHDPRSHRLGGIAGHAGLFSTAEDLAVFVQMMLGHGQHGGVRILEENTVSKMLHPNDVAGRLWGLGWGIRTRAVPNHPDWQVLGHLGYTGTSVRFSPDRFSF